MAQESERDSEVSGGVLRAAEVLSLFVKLEQRSLGVTEIAKRLGLAKAVVYRILASLRQTGLVEMEPDSHRYVLGPQSLLLGLAYLERINVHELARNALANVSETTKETAALSLRVGWESVYVDQVTPQRDITMVVPIGKSSPLHKGSSARAFLAFLRPVERDEYFRVIEQAEDTDVTSEYLAHIKLEVEQIRDVGYAQSAGERQAGAAAVAAPVLGRDGSPEAVLTICGPEERFSKSIDNSIEVLLQTTRSISRQLGNHQMSGKATTRSEQ